MAVQHNLQRICLSDGFRIKLLIFKAVLFIFFILDAGYGFHGSNGVCTPLAKTIPEELLLCCFIMSIEMCIRDSCEGL